MKILILITVISLGFNGHIPGFFSLQNPERFIISKKSCPFSDNNSKINSPFSCPKNSKNGDCPKKYVNRILPVKVEESKTILEFIYEIPLISQLTEFSQTYFFFPNLKPEKPDPPGYLPLLN